MRKEGGRALQTILPPRLVLLGVFSGKVTKKLEQAVDYQKKKWETIFFKTVQLLQAYKYLQK